MRAGIFPNASPPLKIISAWYKQQGGYPQKYHKMEMFFKKTLQVFMYGNLKA